LRVPLANLCRVPPQGPQGRSISCSDFCGSNASSVGCILNFNLNNDDHELTEQRSAYRNDRPHQWQLYSTGRQGRSLKRSNMPHRDTPRSCSIDHHAQERRQIIHCTNSFHVRHPVSYQPFTAHAGLESALTGDDERDQTLRSGDGADGTVQRALPVAREDMPRMIGLFPFAAPQSDDGSSTTG
jgi:hypothetical protein